MELDFDYMTPGQQAMLQEALARLQQGDPSLFNQGDGSTRARLVPEGPGDDWASTNPNGDVIDIRPAAFSEVGTLTSVLGHELVHVNQIQFYGLLAGIPSHRAVMELKANGWEIANKGWTGVGGRALASAVRHYRYWYRRAGEFGYSEIARGLRLR